MPSSSPSTISDLVRAYMEARLDPRPGRTIAGVDLFADYVKWSRWAGVETLSAANFLLVAGAVAGLTGPRGPIEQLDGYAFTADPIRDFLLDETRLREGASVSLGQLLAAYQFWSGTSPTARSVKDFRRRVSLILGRSLEPMVGREGRAEVWHGLALFEPLPEDAVAPFDLTDAATLRALPLDAREVA